MLEEAIASDNNVQITENGQLDEEEFDVNPRIKRPRKVFVDHEPVGPVEEEESEDDSHTDGCPICFEPWTSGGLHRVCSLRCGHLFGKHCIETWLSNGARSKCPQCNLAATKKDIRVLFVKKLMVVDTSERDEMAKQLDEERTLRKRVQNSEMKLRLNYNLALAELNVLREEMEKMRNMGSMDGFRQFQLSDLHFERAFNADPSCQFRGMDCDTHLEMFAVGTNKSLPGGKNFGLCKISLLVPDRIDSMNNLHEQQIKCIRCSTFGDGLVLTSSLDKKLKLSSLGTKSTLLSYDLDAAGWSCCFDPANGNNIFAGLGDGHVCMFDTRNTKAPIWKVEARTLDKSPLPIHSMAIESNQNGWRLMAANMKGLMLANISNDLVVDLSYPESEVSGQCSSLIADPVTKAWIMSVRGNQSSHRFGIYDDGGIGQVKENYVCTFPQTCMVRPSIKKFEEQILTLYPDGPNAYLSLKSMFGEELEHSLLRTNTSNPVLDTTLHRINNKTIIGLLSDRQLNLFSS